MLNHRAADATIPAMPRAMLLAAAIAIAACGSPATASPSPSPSPSAEPSFVPVTDADLAFDAASRFEAARAGAAFDAAWSLLGPSAQRAIGLAEQFAIDEAAYNAQGGTAFIVAEPTREAGLMEQLLAARQAELAAEADLERGHLVFITHPGVPGSAGTRAYLVAPLLVGGEWRIWPLV